MPSIDATVGGPTANSYETHAEANAYFDSRVPIVPPWIPSGQEAALIMATRTLDSLARPSKSLFVDGCGCSYYRIRRQWTGQPATATQRLAWPRTGMVDGNGNPLDYTIVSAALTNPTQVTTSAPHHLVTGQKALIVGSDSVPSLDGEQEVTVLSPTVFTVPVVPTIAGTTGHVYIIPQELKDAESELAGQLLIVDRTLDNDIFKLGITSIRAGSVAVSFGTNQLQSQVIPDAVYNLMPTSWLTDELYEPAQAAEFDVVSE